MAVAGSAEEKQRCDSGMTRSSDTELVCSTESLQEPVKKAERSEGAAVELMFSLTLI